VRVSRNECVFGGDAVLQEGLDAARAAMQRLINDDALVDSKYLQV
jgi:hypothetical protein